MHKVLIIGAGPAGLMCAYELKKRGVTATILESGKSAAQSWLNMPDNLKLGPWISSYVENNIPRYQMCSEPTANEFAHHLINFALSKNISIITNQRVIAVQKRNRFFSLTTVSAQTHNATCVVNATGYFQNPFFPNWANSDLTNSKVIHYSDYKSSETLPKSNHPLKVLVVGGGISAGELIMDLADTSHHITLSTRSKINFEQPKWLQLIVSPFYFWLENNVASFRRFGSSKRYMAGGKIKRIIQSNRVNHIGPILGVEGEYLHHASGVEKFDVILLATGWKSNVTHLDPQLLTLDGEPLVENMQSKVWPGLFFLGFDNLLSFRSRFIRGIREDSKCLANNILNYLGIKKTMGSGS